MFSFFKSPVAVVPVDEELPYGQYEPEATDPYILRQLTDAISSVVHTDETLPKDFDAARTIAVLAINGETEALRRAATLELLAWVRRSTYVSNTFSSIVRSMSEAIGNKAADFPQAKELSDECKKIYDEHMSGLPTALRGQTDNVFTGDLSEILGTKQYVRDQIASFAPNAD